MCWDNAVAESFFATYKKELIHTRPWPNIDQPKTATFTWIETYYNRTRRHSTLNYLTPLEYELGFKHSRTCRINGVHEIDISPVAMSWSLRLKF